MNEIMSKDTYDAFSEDYDRFVNWKERLDAEMPFLTSQLEHIQVPNDQPLSLLDAACGTGMHAIELSKHGFRAAGADLSPQMIRKAEENARRAGVEVQFKAIGFGGLANAFQKEGQFPFDAVLCLGNSLPHLLSIGEIENALSDFAACLRPGGLLILQNRNFDAVLTSQDRWFPPQSHSRNGEERLFIRFYDYDSDGLVTFHIMRLHRSGDDEWKQEIDSARLLPLTKDDLQSALANSGFEDPFFFGKLENIPFDPQNSGNLVVTTRKKL